VEIISSISFDAPQYIYLEERKSLPPLLYQEHEANGQKCLSVSEVTQTGELTVLHRIPYDPKGSEGFYMSWSRYGLKRTRWERGNGHIERLTQLDFLCVDRTNWRNVPTVCSIV